MENTHRPHAEGPTSSQDSRKYLYVLYNGEDSWQSKNVRTFRDALAGGEGGEQMKIKVLDVSKEPFDVKAWVKQANHIIVLSVTAEGIELLKEVVKGVDGPKGATPNRLLTVSFGMTSPTDLLGAVLQRPAGDMRDFCFGFDEHKAIKVQEFDRSHVMKLLRTTILATH